MSFCSLIERLRRAVAVAMVLALPMIDGSFAADDMTGREVASAVSDYRQKHEREILTEYFEFLSIPNHASNQEDILRNARHMVQMMKKRGITTKILDNAPGSPAVYGELKTPGATTTILFYSHYDGQRVVPENWSSDPFKPVLKTNYLARGGKEVSFDSLSFPVDPDLRIFARSTSDDKAPIAMVLSTLDALKAKGIPLSVNLKFFFEGEEESGSPYLENMLKKHGHLLKSDLMLFADGPVHQSGKKKLTFGARGPVGFEVTVYGPDRPLHSGHYGNYAPNPITMLAHLIASMRADDSRITIAGFYDEVLAPTSAELAAISRLPRIDKKLHEELAIGRQESPGVRYQESILWPALNLKGIRAGEVGGKSRNAIVTTATAAFGYRMVPNQTPALLKKLTEKHIEAQGYHIVRERPDVKTRRRYERVAKVTWTNYGYPGLRTPVDLPVSVALISILRDDLGYKDLVVIPSSGGSLPISYFDEALKVPLIMLPIANYDNNQHAQDENIRIGNLWDGMEMYAGVFAKFGHRYKP
ncbi:MAG: peptidase M20 [Alphaproteobacteria bacterium]|nr:MAG: peptidase M20 [Alphaproteobacteria bacterium]